jgi:galactose mutarotase-like enzyme
MLGIDWLRRELVESHSLDMRQFIDFRQSTLPNGMRIVEAYNASGVSYTILPDRGLDIWSATYNGAPLAWLALGSPYPPDRGQSWLRQFNGGLLATCGLTHAGPPETQPITDGGRDLHGLYSQLPAYGVAVRRAWQDDGRYVLELGGTVSETRLFGEQLRLERTYRLTLGEPVIEWSDRVTNAGDLPMPLMVLYHINLGYPLIRQGTQFHSAYEAVYPRDAEARKGADRWPHYEAATPRYAEQVYWHHVKADGDGRTVAALLQDDFGLQFEYDTTQLPYLTQWKNYRQGIYVCGIEPGNCLPEGQVAARDTGRLVMIEPGEIQEFAVRLTVLDGTEAVQQSRDEIDQLRLEGMPAACKLDDYA